jgi:MHS family proline/betaine transporter-like MFS transporter
MSVTAVGHGLPANYWSRAMAGVYGAWFIVLGNILEWYEFSLYGYLAPEMQKNFFDNSSIGAWAGFGVTFVARPLGAFALGWVGDLFGRRIALLISLSGMMICTVCHCLPSPFGMASFCLDSSVCTSPVNTPTAQESASS